MSGPGVTRGYVLEEIYVSGALCIVIQLSSKSVCPSQQPLKLCSSKRGYCPFDQRCSILHVVDNQGLLYGSPESTHGSEYIAGMF